MTVRPPSNKPARPKHVEQAYERIKGRILDNEYSPGYQATEEQLARSMEMSRTPVREALVRLAKEGLVELIPRRGMRVVPLAPRDVKEIYELLTALEATAAALLARRGLPRRDFEPMERALDDMDETLALNDLDGWVEADERFHRSLLRLCGNQRLASTAYGIWDQVHRARRLSLRLRKKPIQASVDHRRLFEAICRGDADAARELHYRHGTEATLEMTQLLEEYRFAAI